MVADIEVMLWLPKVPNVGHLSLKLSDGFYISFWPENRSGMKKTSQGHTYKEDHEAEGRSPDKILFLPPKIVDQDKIKSWWNGVLNDKGYNLVSNNCSSVVREALRKGGIKENVVTTSVFAVSRPIDNPSSVFSWAGNCKEFYLGNIATGVAREFLEPATNNVKILWNWIPGLE